MNLVVSDNLDAITPDVLPAKQPGDRVRLLCLSIMALGLKSNGLEMVKATEDRDDVEAVHVLMTPSTIMRAFGANLPAGLARLELDFAASRRRFSWKKVIDRWLRTRLPIEHFDAIHVITRGHALGVLPELSRHDPERKKVLAVAIDATPAADAREFGGPRTSVGRFQHRIQMNAERRLYERCDLVLCRSQWAADSVLNDFGAGDRSKTLVVPPSPSMSPKPRVPFAGDMSRPYRIGLCGNTWDRKGGPRLMRWFAERWQDRAELHVVSRDAEVPPGVKNVTWTPRMERESLLKDYYPSLDLFVLPTKQDQITWVLAEGAGAGVAAVAPRMAGIPEAVLHEKTGLIIDDNDDAGFITAVERLLDDRELTDRFGAAALDHARATMSREKNYPAVIDRIVELARGRRAAGS